MTTADIIPLFSTPLYYSKVSNNFTDEISLIKELDTIPAVYNNVSKKTDILNIEELSSCKHICEHHLKNYVDNTFNCEQEFYIVNSWFAISKPGEKHQIHFHPNSIVSGVLYLQCDEHAGNIVFHHESSLKKDFNFGYNTKDYNMFNSNIWKHPVYSGDIVIFPGWLRHSVEENKSNKERIIIGFNAFTKGVFGSGSDDYSSELILRGE